MTERSGFLSQFTVKDLIIGLAIFVPAVIAYANLQSTVSGIKDNQTQEQDIHPRLQKLEDGFANQSTSLAAQFQALQNQIATQGSTIHDLSATIIAQGQQIAQQTTQIVYLGNAVQNLSGRENAK